MAESYPEGALERLQQIELDIMLKIDELCRREGLTYFIHSGTGIGAARHGGFIPWDDDIDIGMPLDDYLRFLDIASSELPEGYTLCNAQNAPDCPVLFSKVFRDGTRFVDDSALEAGFELGIFVDIFPFVQLDERPREAKRQLARLDLWKNMMYLYYMAHPHLPKSTPLKPVVRMGTATVHAILRVIESPGRIRRNFERWLRPAQPSDQWVSACYVGSGVFPGEVLFPPCEVEFCGHKLLAPADPDAKLRIEYGDYMQIPAVEDRHTHTPEILDFGDGVNVMGGRP